MEDKRIQWHPGFVAAMNLELAQNRNDLIFQKEYNLNTKPLEIDLLIIKKEPAVEITNEIGKIFRRYNILEYKNPTDQLNIDTFYKTEAYAALYKSYGKTTDGIRAEDITVSILREAKPTALFHYFSQHNITVSNPYAGIYYLEGAVLFPTQIVVTKELDSFEHTWLTALSEHIPEQNMRQLVYKVNRLTDTFDKEMAESVMQVTLGANQNLIQKIKGEDTMYEVLLEIMEPEISEIKQKSIDEGKQKGRQEGRQEAIKDSVDVLRQFGHSDDEIKAALIDKYHLSEKEVLAFLH